MEDLLIEALRPFGYPVRRQGSLGPEEAYPESFFTFWNNATEGDGFFDNQETRVVWDYDLNFYSTDPELVYSTLEEAKKALRKAGFLMDGLGHDVASDEPTHTGRGIHIIFSQNKKQGGAL